MAARAFLALQALLLTSSASAQPVLTVSPKEAVFDAPFNVALEGALANSRITIRTSRATEDGTVCTTDATFVTDDGGFVDAAKTAAIKGSYTGVSPHGLLCSALPESASSFATYLAELIDNSRLPRSFVPPLEPVPITVEASIDGKVIAATSAVRGHGIGVAEEEVATEDGLRGVYFAPVAGRKVKEPVLLLNGSGGGVRIYAAARLASHGHPTFAFAIYNYADLPSTLKN